MGDETSLDETLYDVTFETIVGVMELLNGYRGGDLGKVSVVCKRDGERLKEETDVELHDEGREIYAY